MPGTLVEVVCPACERTTTYSTDEPAERRVCPFCTGQMPDACCEDCEEDDAPHG